MILPETVPYGSVRLIVCGHPRHGSVEEASATMISGWIISPPISKLRAGHRRQPSRDSRRAQHWRDDHPDIHQVVPWECWNPEIAGIVLAHTAYTNPVGGRSEDGRILYCHPEKPVIIPLLYLTIALWPLAWLMNWMSYFNGSSPTFNARNVCSPGTKARGQLDFCSRFTPHARSPTSLRGMLGMIAYDARALPSITIPAHRDCRRQRCDDGAGSR